MAFDIDEEGHHPAYIHHLVKYWCAKKLPGHLDIVVSPLFIKKYDDLVSTISSCKRQRVELVPIEADDYAKLQSQRLRILRYFEGWKLFCRYAAKLQANHGLLMYFDFFQLPSVLSTDPPCPFSGIYFRPTFHYHNFANYVPSLQERFRASRKQWLLSRVLCHPALKNLCQKLCVLLVGPVESSQRDSVKNHIDKLRRTLPVQIILRDDLILDRDIQPYFHLADVVLATYQHHMGMSSILVRAAQARKPVLASSYGLLGEIVNRRDLGLTIDSTRPQEIARGIRTFISEECNVAFDPNQALAFAHENSAEQFAHTLFKYLF